MYSIIQGISKRLGQTSRMGSHQSKEKVSDKRKSRNECVFSLIPRLRPTIITVTVWYFITADMIPLEYTSQN